MSITVKIDGERRVGRISLTLLSELSEATGDAANAIQNFTKQQIRSGPPRSGKIRKRGKRGAKSDRASKRGEWPKADTGTLGRSIIARHQRGTLKATVGSHLKYAEILESDQLDRKHITRAAEELRPFVVQLAQRAIQRSIQANER